MDEASSVPAITSIDPRMVCGNAFNKPNKLLPKRRPKVIFPTPRIIGATPDLDPNLYCAAKPPDPWQQGIAPIQQPIRFRDPTHVATILGPQLFGSFSGKSEEASAETAITEFKRVRGNCGRPASHAALFRLVQDGWSRWGMDGPNLKALIASGELTAAMTTPATTKISAWGTRDNHVYPLAVPAAPWPKFAVTTLERLSPTSAPQQTRPFVSSSGPTSFMEACEGNGIAKSFLFGELFPPFKSSSPSVSRTLPSRSPNNDLFSVPSLASGSDKDDLALRLHRDHHDAASLGVEKTGSNDEEESGSEKGFGLRG
mmetsp:Transcript_30881/g.56181  ORF Transcript_30881/g.56181 Transcript_30881/m.56181 type:complete len:314 (+) Transcript_30881:825-1766(+)